MVRTLFKSDIDGASGDVYYCELAGLSTDDKPAKNVSTGSVFIEVNTGDVYLFDETGSGMWRKISGNSPVPDNDNDDDDDIDVR